MEAAIVEMKRASAALARGDVVMPPRTHLDIEPHAGVSLTMPCYVVLGLPDFELLDIVSDIA